MVVCEIALLINPRQKLLTEGLPERRVGMESYSITTSEKEFIILMAINLFRKM